MLMKRARAYSSSCSQAILVYSIHFVAVHSSAAENRKKITKPLFCGSRSFKNINVDTSKKHAKVLVMIRSTTVPIRNPFHARQAKNRKIGLTTF